MTASTSPLRRVSLPLIAVGLLILGLSLVRPPGPPTTPTPSPTAPPAPTPIRAESPNWKDLEPGHGRIAWVETRLDPIVGPPDDPAWARDRAAWGIADGIRTPPSAGFGTLPGDLAAAWFLIVPSRLEKDLWHVDKQRSRLVDAAGRMDSLPGGTGALRLQTERSAEPGAQYLYVLVPRSRLRSGVRLRAVLSRFDGGAALPVELPF